MALATENMQLNFGDNAAHSEVAADAVDYLKDIGDNMFGVGIPRLLAVVITGGSYKLWHNTFVSMAAGTLSYMGLLYLFSHVLTMA